MTGSDSIRAEAPSLDDAILNVLQGAGGKTLSPPEIAVEITAGSDWHALLVPIRRAAVDLARHGRLVIYRRASRWIRTISAASTGSDCRAMIRSD